ncbi:prolyl-tRNA editing enzyme YbaK/EbsC (Cys-tRNA(Pro) deacylase) [Streptomyces canus]
MKPEGELSDDEADENLADEPVLRRLGYRVAGDGDEAKRLLRVYDSLGLNSSQFRTAVLSWLVGKDDGPSMAVVLRTAQRLGLRSETEPNFLDAQASGFDGSRFYAWIDAMFDPQHEEGRRDVLRQPHERLYWERSADWRKTGTGKSYDPLEDIQSLVAGDQYGRLSSAQMTPSVMADRRHRLEAMRDWLRGNEAHANLLKENLRPGHFLALYLVSGSDGQLLGAWMGSPSGPAERLREVVGELLGGAFRPGGRRDALPLLLLRDDAFRQLADRVVDGQGRVSERAKAALVGRALRVVEGMRGELAGHAHMAVEAGQRLAPLIGRNLYWGRLESGSLEGALAGKPNRQVSVGALHPATVSGSVAFRELAESARHAGQDSHPVLYEVVEPDEEPNTTAVGLAVFARKPSGQSALYPAAADFTVISEKIRTHTETGLRYLHRTLMETSRPLAEHAWDQPIMSHPVYREDDGTPIGAFNTSLLHNSQEAELASEIQDSATYLNGHLVSGNTYQVPWRYGVPWRNRPLLWNSHSDGTAYRVPAPSGMKWAPGHETGRFQRQLFRSMGAAEDMPLVLASCYAGKNLLAQTTADQHRGRATFGAESKVAWMADHESLMLTRPQKYQEQFFISFQPRDARTMRAERQAGIAGYAPDYGYRFPVAVWKKAVEDFEKALAARLVGRRELREVVRWALQARRDALAAAVQDPDAGFFAATEAGFDPRAAMARLLDPGSDASLDELLTAFDQETSGGTVRAGLDTPRSRIDPDTRLRTAVREPYELLDLKSMFDEFQALGAPQESRNAFLAAVIAWQPLLPGGGYALADVVRSSGFDDSPVIKAALTSAVDLYVWARDVLDSGDQAVGRRPELPHQRAYLQTVSWFGEVESLEGVLRDGPALARRHGLALGHVAALVLLNGPGGELFSERLLPEPAGLSDEDALGVAARAAVSRAFEAGDLDAYPLSFLGDAQFRELADEAEDLMLLGEHRTPGEEERHRRLRDELLARAASLLGGFRSEMSRSLRMGHEALQVLAPVNQAVRFAFWASGDLSGGLVGKQDGLVVPRFGRAAVRSPQEILQAMGSASGPGQHRVLVEVETSSARSVSDFALGAAGAVMYADDTVLDVVDRRLVETPLGPVEYLVVKEADRQGDVSMSDMESDDGLEAAVLAELEGQGDVSMSDSESDDGLETAVLEALEQAHDTSMTDASDAHPHDEAQAFVKGPPTPTALVAPARTRLALTSEDQGVYERAIGYLTELDADASRRVNAWAIERVAADHYVPVALEPTTEDHARQRLEADFVSLVAFTYGTRGAVAAEALSLRLAHDYGTRRTVQVRGGAPGDATPVAVARMRYLQEAARFEEDLAGYLAEHEAATAELGKMTRAAWRVARDRGLDDKQLRLFGTSSPTLPGAVGTSLSALEAVAHEGNSRERETFLYRGIITNLISDLLGHSLSGHAELDSERADRIEAEPSRRAAELIKQAGRPRTPSAQKKQAQRDAAALRQSNIRAAYVRPPLSEAERKIVGKSEFLPWDLAMNRYAMREGSDLQVRSRATGGLVLTGTSGRIYRLLNVAVLMNQRWGLDLDLGLVRLAAIGASLSARHHTFHEAMRGAQLALEDQLGHDPALDYVDNWSRYLHLAPLSEDELRSVANGGKFPHEHAMEMLRPRPTAIPGRLPGGGSGKARAEEPVRSTRETPADAHEEYSTALAQRSRAVAAFADVVLARQSGEGPSLDSRLASAQARLSETGQRLAEATERLAVAGLDITLREPVISAAFDVSSAMSGLVLNPDAYPVAEFPPDGGPARRDGAVGGTTRAGGHRPDGSVVETRGGDVARSQGIPSPKPVRGADNVMIMQPGYASGDQFGISASLIHNPNLHVLIARGPAPGAPGHETRDKSAAIADFYRTTGIEADRIHFADVPSLDLGTMWPVMHREATRIAQEDWGIEKTFNQMRRERRFWNVTAGTDYIAKVFSPELRVKLRTDWGLEQRHDPAIAAWMADRGIQLPPSRGKVLLLWSRFTGKSEQWTGLHGRMEHDTSFQGTRQILRDLAPEYDTVIITGDPESGGKWGRLVTEMRDELGIDTIHEITGFWKGADQGLAAWGGNTRNGQFRVYDYLDRHHDLQHLGFRSGNLEAVALIGHQVRYLEEVEARANIRVQAWRDAGDGLTPKGGLAPGYERVLVSEPPTASGRYAKKFNGGPLDGQYTPPEPGAVWVKPVEVYGEERGFSYDDLDAIREELKLPKRRGNQTEHAFHMDRIRHIRRKYESVRDGIRQYPADSRIEATLVWLDGVFAVSPDTYPGGARSMYDDIVDQVLPRLPDVWRYHRWQRWNQGSVQSGQVSLREPAEGAEALPERGRDGMSTPMDAFDDVRPAIECLDRLAAPVADALRTWRGTVPVEQLLYVDTDPDKADTTVLAENYGSWLLELSANCVVVAAKRAGGVTSLAAAMVLAHTRADVNGVVRRHLGARKVSFAPMGTAIGESGMESGGITPIGLPGSWPIMVDAAVAEVPYLIIGSGSRRGKLIVPGKALAGLPGVTVLDGLGKDAGWRSDLVRRQGPHGVGYFSDADWVSRSGSFGQLPRLTHVAVWGEGGRGLPEVLPVPGGVAGERFFFARHGRAGGLSRAEGRELAVEAAASGFRDVYLLPCYSPGVAGSRPEVDLGEWAREHGRTVHEALGRSAVTESSDGRFGPVLWHVALDGTDGASAIRSYRPDGTVVETRAGTGIRSRGIPFPADVLWNVPPQVGGPMASAPRTIPRFPFYGTPEWERATREYEKAVATAIAKRESENLEVQKGIEYLFKEVGGLSDPRVLAFSRARQRMRREVDPSLSDLMEVFSLGADVFLDEWGLSDDVADDDLADAAELRRLGYRVVGDGTETKRLLRAFAGVGLKQSNFRPAVLSWLVGKNDGPSMAVVLRAAQQVGLRSGAEPDLLEIGASGFDASQFYSWIDTLFDPRHENEHSDVLRQPHERLYWERGEGWLRNSADGSYNSVRDVQFLVVGDELPPVEKNASAVVDRRHRLEAMRDWLRGNEAHPNLLKENLRPGHFLALYLVSGSDGQLLGAWMGSPSGPAERLREVVGELLGGAFRPGGRGDALPLLLLRDDAFRQLADRVVDGQGRVSERAKAALVDRALRVVEGMRGELTGHAHMAVEAGHLLAPLTGHKVYWGRLESGSLEGALVGKPSHRQVSVGALHRATVSGSVAFRELAESARHAGQDSHPVLYEVVEPDEEPNTTAVGLAVFARKPSDQSALYPAAANFTVISEKIRTHTETGLRYLHRTLMEESQPFSENVWERPITSLTVQRADDGTPIGALHIDANNLELDTAHRVQDRRTFANVVDRGKGQIFGDGRHPVPWSSRPVFWSGHSDGQSYWVPTPFGMKSAPGHEAGRFQREIFRSMGAAEDMPLVLASCYAGRDRLAQTTADQHRKRLTFGAQAVIRWPLAGDELQIKRQPQQHTQFFVTFQPRDVRTMRAEREAGVAGYTPDYGYRFPLPAWKKAVEDFEKALAARLVGRQDLREVVRSALRAHRGAMASAAQAPDARFFTTTGGGFNPRVAMNRLLDSAGGATLDELLTAFDQATTGGKVRAGLDTPRNRIEPDTRFRTTVRKSYELLHLAELFEAFHHLDMPKESRNAFLAAVIAWQPLLPGGGYALADVVRSSGFDDNPVIKAALTSAVDLYVWARDVLDSGDLAVGRRPELPHQRAYLQTVSWFGEVESLGGVLRDGPTLARRHGLALAHVAALVLLNGPGGELFSERLLPEPAGLSDEDALGVAARAAVSRAFEAGDLDAYPLSFLGDAQFRELADQAADLAIRGEHRTPDEEEKYRQLRDELSARTTSLLGDFRGEMSRSLRIGYEALQVLAPVNQAVRFAFWASGDLSGGLVGKQDGLVVPRFGRAGTQTPQEILEAMGSASGPGQHRVLVEVETSSARSVSDFVPGATGAVMYADDTVLDVVDRRLVETPLGPVEYLVVKEADPEGEDSAQASDSSEAMSDSESDDGLEAELLAELERQRDVSVSDSPDAYPGQQYVNRAALPDPGPEASTEELLARAVPGDRAVPGRQGETWPAPSGIDVPTSPVRFGAALYGEETWTERAAAYEVEVGRWLTAHRPDVDTAAERALDAVRGQLPDLTAREFGVGLGSPVENFLTAVSRHRGALFALARPHAVSPWPRGRDQRDGLGRRGFLLSAEDQTPAPTEWVWANTTAYALWLHRELGLPAADRALLRDALLGQALAGRTATMYEVLRAFDALGFSDARLREAFRGEAADLYQWAHRRLGSGVRAFPEEHPGDCPAPPHLSLYDVIVGEPSAEDRAHAAELGVLPQHAAAFRHLAELSERGAVADPFAEAHTDPEVQAVLRRWVDRWIAEAAPSELPDGFSRPVLRDLLADEAGLIDLVEQRVDDPGNRDALYAGFSYRAGRLAGWLKLQDAMVVDGLAQLPAAARETWSLLRVVPDEELAALPREMSGTVVREGFLESASLADVLMPFAESGHSGTPLVMRVERSSARSAADMRLGDDSVLVSAPNSAYEVIALQTITDPDTNVIYNEVTVTERDPLPSRSAWLPRRPQRRDLATDGRRFGEAYFSDEDWQWRRDTYQRLPEISRMRVWDREGGSELREVPIGDRSRAYYPATHGAAVADLGAVAEEFAARSGDGTTDLVLTLCAPQTAAADSSRLRELAVGEGLDVHVLGRMAVTPGEKGEPGLFHLLPDEQGNPASWTTYRRDGTVVSHVGASGTSRLSGSSPRADGQPPQAYVNTAGEPRQWKNGPLREPVEPRFPQLYAPEADGGPSRYEELSEEYETALRKVLSAHRELHAEVIGTLDALFNHYEPHFGKNTFKVFANRRNPDSPEMQFKRLTDKRSDATLDERIEAFADAVYAHPDYPEALSKLWDKKPERGRQQLPAAPDAAVPYSPETLQQAREYGYRFSESPPEKVTYLMRVRSALEVPNGNPMAFRDSLVAWGLKTHTLAEVLSATQKAGVRDETEPSRPVDAARLYAWSHAQFDPRRIIEHSVPTAFRQEERLRQFALERTAAAA